MKHATDGGFSIINMHTSCFKLRDISIDGGVAQRIVPQIHLVSLRKPRVVDQGLYVAYLVMMKGESRSRLVRLARGEISLIRVCPNLISVKPVAYSRQVRSEIFFSGVARLVSLWRSDL